MPNNILRRWVLLFAIVCITLYTLVDIARSLEYDARFSAMEDRIPTEVSFRWRANPTSFEEVRNLVWVDLGSAVPEPDSRCYKATVDVPGAGYLEARILDDDWPTPSEWSRSIPVPEPPPSAMGFGLLALGFLTRRRAYPSAP